MSVALHSGTYFDDTKGETSLEEFTAFINLSDNQDKTFELIDGYMVMMSGNTSFNHQRISGYIFSEIHQYLRGKQCEAIQDINVYLYKENIGKCKNIFQPDILVGCDKTKMTDRGYEGTPEFIVEVISKSTASFDYFVKCARYMQFGVKEYWIVDLYLNQVLVYINKEEGRPIVRSYTFDDTISIGIFGDLRIDFKEILKIVDLYRQ